MDADSAFLAIRLWGLAFGILGIVALFKVKPWK